MAATQAVPFTAVTFDDAFWAPRQVAVRRATIPFLYQQYEKAGIFAAPDDGLHDACVRLWRDLTQKRLYITGGLGPSWANEGSGRPGFRRP